MNRAIEKEIIDLGLGIFDPIYIPQKYRDSMIRHFETWGESIRSTRTDSIGWLINYCEVNKIHYLVTTHNDLVYIKKIGYI